MEPITAAWMMTSLLSGCVGNRGDALLCKGANKLYNIIRNKINEPTNHHIQKAIRKSYLHASILAIDKIQKQKKRYSLTDKSWQNIQEVRKYVLQEISYTTKEDANIRTSVLDIEYRDILFPQNKLASDRSAELIKNFKDSIIKEFENKGLFVGSELKDCIYIGWEEENKKMDFYKLTCAFFTQELKENHLLSTYIQTEYLDCINNEVGEISIQMDELSDQLNLSLEAYKEILPSLDKILSSIDRLEDTLSSLPYKTADLVLKAIRDENINYRVLKISEEYQKFERELELLGTDLLSLKKRIEDVKSQIVDENTDRTAILKLYLKDLENQLFQKDFLKHQIETAFSEFVSDIINLAKQLKLTEGLDSERLEKARELFNQGRYKEVLEVLNEKEIDLEIEQYEEKRLILVNELTIKAQTTVLTKEEGWFQEAVRLYAKALDLKENFKTTFYYASFMAEYNQIIEADNLFKRCFTQITNVIEKAFLLSNYAKLQNEKKEFMKAEKSYRESLKIFRDIVNENHNKYLPDLGEVLFNLANLLNYRNNYNEAEELYIEALMIYLRLEFNDPSDNEPSNDNLFENSSFEYFPIILQILKEMVNIKKEKIGYTKSDSFIEDALKILEEVALINSAKSLYILIGILQWRMKL